jgi:mono/diheme cytochrome c family protein
MLSRLRTIDRGVLAAVLGLLGLGGTRLCALTAVQAKAASPRSLLLRSAQAAPPPATGKPAIRALFQKYCTKCHESNGTGKAARDLLPDIPDFTKSAWQKKRSDAQLQASILEGEKTGMPAFAGKVTKSQARDLVRHIRTFAPAAKKPRQEQQEQPTGDGFEERFRHLHQEMEELQRQFHELSERSAGKKGSKPSKLAPHPDGRFMDLLQ